MSSTNGTHIYLGVWTNWSRGAIRGATLTISQRDGSFLAAFLALYVSFAGGMFWKFLAFVLHQLNTTEIGTKRDALHYQRQVILRNSGGAAEAFVEFVMMPWNWHKRAKSPFLRISPYAFLAALNVVTFAIASIFTSAVTRAPGNSVIVLGPSCGGYTFANKSVADEGYSYKLVADTNEAAAYVRQCYEGNVSSRACDSYYRPRLNFTTTARVACPFAPEVCYPGNKSAFSMDTGLVDSHSDLGVNARPEHRIKYRRVTTCSPLHDKPWFRVVNGTDGYPVIYIDAGPTAWSDYSFSYNLRAAGNGFGYALSAIYALVDSTGDWKPDNLLNRTDADVVLMMLNQNDIGYEAPSDDPWISAHVPATNKSNNDVWVADYSLSLMGCTDQYQICNPSKGDNPSACTKLQGQAQVIRDLDSAGLNDHQAWTAIRILVSAITMSMFNAVQTRGASALNAGEYLMQTIQPPLLPTQWQTEVTIWFSTCLAKLQSYMVEWATAPTNIQLTPGGRFGPNVPTDPIPLAMCHNQMVQRTGGQQSFSLLGLALIFTLGGIVILLGLTIETVFGWLRNKRDYRLLQWILEDKLQLHRVAYEGAGTSGLWEGRLDDVPVTISDRGPLPPSSDAFPHDYNTPESQQQLKY